jgi:hypothetical protein
MRGASSAALPPVAPPVAPLRPNTADPATSTFAPAAAASGAVSALTPPSTCTHQGRVGVKEALHERAQWGVPQACLPRMGVERVESNRTAPLPNMICSPSAPSFND